MSRIAIIDLGTNTFNLLIVEVNPDKSYRPLYQTKTSVKLGEGGINKGIIEPVPFQRGIDALKNFKELIKELNAEKVYAFGTSALRDAINSKAFLEKAEQETAIVIQTISGEREAELIYYGVRSAVKMEEALSLIIDIGGGSTEFIIANKNEIIWKRSFLLGAARLLEKFNPSDPITNEQVQHLNSYLRQELRPLFGAIEKHPVAELVGASGSFDSLAEMIAYKYYTRDLLQNKTEYTFNLDDCEGIYKVLLRSTKAERLKMKGLVPMRVDMIVISCILVYFIITSFNIQRMRLSTFSLKEGVLYEVLNNDN